MNASRQDFVLRHLKRGSAFLLVGGLGFVVDAVIYNLLVYAGHPHGVLFQLPLVAKTLSVCCGLVASYFGNRLWTYRDRRGTRSFSQVLRYALVNVAATLLQLACLWFSRSVLHLANPVADNISGTIIGQGLATAFRYIVYTKWVFRHETTSAISTTVLD
jgi:putative flippase GtrA